MNYLSVAIISFVTLFVYRRLALRLGILDQPNKRSSHTKPTVRGGGIVFPILAIVWFVLNDYQYPFFLSGILLVALVSFTDDLRGLSFKLRLLTQFAAVALMFLDVNSLGSSWIFLLALSILSVGWLNAYNFMDGINGITSLYALSVLGSLWLTNKYVFFIEDSIIVTTVITTAVFSFYNVRRKALLFAGDIGSVSLAFLLAFLMINLLATSEYWFFILFFLVYGVDAVITIVERLLQGENIFEAHRSHLYQQLCNEFGWKHLQVAFIYAGTQLLISALIITGYLFKMPGYTYLIVAFITVAGYILLKSNLRRTLKTRTALIIHDEGKNNSQL